MSGAFPAPVGPKLSLLILPNLNSPCIFIEVSAVFQNCIDQYCFYDTSEKRLLFEHVAIEINEHRR